MRVLFTTNLPSPYRVDFFNELGKRVELTVLYERSAAKDRHRMWLNRTATTYEEVFLRGLSMGGDSGLCFGILKWLRGRKYDLVIVGGWSTPTGMLAIQYLSITDQPFLLNVDGGQLRAESTLVYKIKKYFIGRATAWLSTSKASDEYLTYYGASQENIYRYPFSSIRDHRILQAPLYGEAKVELRNRLGMKENRVIVSVGRFIPGKGFDWLIRACSRLQSDVGVYIIGGEPTGEYIRLREDYGLRNVHFVEFKPEEELADYYKAADVFVLPTRGDVWGLVINEAMANGLPVVTTTKCVAGLELIEDGVNGYLVNVEDENSLVNRLEVLMNDEGLRLTMQKANLRKIRKRQTTPT